MRPTAILLAAALLTLAPPLAASSQERAPAPAPGGDIPAHFAQPTDAYDYQRREVMIPMRDGIRLHTIIIVPRGARVRLPATLSPPRGARGLPILLTRAPYNASARTARANSPHMLAALPEGD